MSIYGEIQRFDPESLVVLYEIINPNTQETFRFHAGVNEFMGEVVWQGKSYIALPIKASGFDYSGTSFPRPKLQIANFKGSISGLVIDLDDLIGFTVIKKSTLSKYLDAINFKDGNPTANPLEAFPDEIYKVGQKTQENKLYVEFELCSPLDLSNVMIPQRQAIAPVCTWVYRSEGCGYTGGAVADINDYPTSVLSEDRCSHKVSGCKLRFGINGNLRYGGFIGLQLINL